MRVRGTGMPLRVPQKLLGFLVGLLIVSMVTIKLYLKPMLQPPPATPETPLSIVRKAQEKVSSYLSRQTLQLSKQGSADGKVIYGATWSNMDWDWLHFSQCPFSNCVARKYEQGLIYTDADVVILEQAATLNLTELLALERVSKRRADQLWLFFTHEATIYTPWAYKLDPSLLLDHWFNATMTFRRDSTIYYPYGSIKPHKTNVTIRREYPEKTHGAYAYVFNCAATGHYDRLSAMKWLGNYIDVDIFGKCGSGERPCPQRFSVECEADVHRKYRFFLAFENSLCSDYITEKFWLRLACDGWFVPVVIGGWSMDDYLQVAPPNSFIHADNFTSIQQLGKYLRHLMEDDLAYSRYHEWRREYKVYNWTNPDALGVSCKLCELANKKPSMPLKTDIRRWFDEKSSYCRTKDYW